MNFTKSFLLVILMITAGTWQAAAQEPAPSAQTLGALKSSAAFSQYQKRPKSELSKLIFLMDRFQGSPAEVIYNGSHYDSEFALKTAKSYMASHYNKKQAADKWIREHAYRSNPGRQVILYKEPESAPVPLRDVLLQELEALKKA